MGVRTAAGSDTGDDLSSELAIEIIDASDVAIGHDRTTVEAAAPAPPLTVWIDDLRETVDDVLAPARKATEATGLFAGTWLHRLGVRRKQRIADRHPRRRSRIRVHVFLPFEAACSRLPTTTTAVVARGAVLRFEGPFEPHRAGRRARARLRLAGSWPGLPVWIDIEPWWRRQTIVTLSLRTTRRVRYPRRYFSAGHRTLRRLVATLART